MAIYAYTKEVHDFVREHCTKMRDAELAEACNKACGTEFTQSKMKAFRANHGCFAESHYLERMSRTSARTAEQT